LIWGWKNEKKCYEDNTKKPKACRCIYQECPFFWAIRVFNAEIGSDSSSSNTDYAAYDCANETSIHFPPLLRGRWEEDEVLISVDPRFSLPNSCFCRLIMRLFVE